MGQVMENCSSCGASGKVQVGGASRELMPCGSCGGAGKVPRHVPDQPGSSNRNSGDKGCALFLFAFAASFGAVVTQLLS